MILQIADEFEYKNFYTKIIEDIKEYLKINSTNNIELECLVFYLLWSIQQGNLCIDINQKLPQDFSQLFKPCYEQLSNINFFSILEQIKKNQNFNHIFYLYNNQYLYFRKHFSALKTLQNKINSIRYELYTLNQEQIKKVESYFSQLNQTRFNQFKLNEEQIKAILLSLFMPLLVISGGPGTGKTTVASHIIGIHLMLGTPPNKIAITAPTGRASTRLKESIDNNLKDILNNQQEELSLLEPKTLHRLLYFDPKKNQFRHNQENPLRYKLFIIDETSMIDIFLIQSLFLALPDIIKNEIRIVFLGDKDQLPSVMEGNVLEDLIPTQTIFNNDKFFENFIKEIKENINSVYKKDLEIDIPYVVYLRDSYRNVQDIKELAEKIMKSSTNDLQEFLKKFKIQEKEKLDQKNSQIIWYESNEEKIYEIIKSKLKKIYKEINQNLENLKKSNKEEWKEEEIKKIYDTIMNFKILTPTKVGPLGFLSINEEIIKELFNGEKFSSGIPIMITENDYYNQLFNGDIGILLQDKQDNFYTCFIKEDKVYFYSLLFLKNYEIAFSGTIHKSQGSEYKEVMLILPKIETLDKYNKNIINLLNKKILYTGITRAKEKLYIISTWESIKFSIEKTQERISGMKIWEKDSNFDQYTMHLLEMRY